MIGFALDQLCFMVSGVRFQVSAQLLAIEAENPKERMSKTDYRRNKLSL
jgi:hypothetical protein